MKSIYLSGEVVSDASVHGLPENTPLISPGRVKQFLESSGDEDIVLEINSPGGSVTAALAIIDFITKARNSSRTITARVYGIAASAATIICCACDRVEMSDVAFFMIHQSSSFAIGNSQEMTNTAEVLAKIDKMAINLYMKKASKGVSREDFQKAMEKETWLLGEEVRDYFNFDVLTDKDGQDEIDLQAKLSVSEEAALFCKNFYKQSPEKILSTLNMEAKETPATDEPKAEEPKAEEPKAEETPSSEEEPKAEESKAEEVPSEDPKAEEVPSEEQPKAEEPTEEEPKAEEPTEEVTEEPKAVPSEDAQLKAGILEMRKYLDSLKSLVE